MTNNLIIGVTIFSFYLFDTENVRVHLFILEKSESGHKASMRSLCPPMADGEWKQMHTLFDSFLLPFYTPCYIWRHFRCKMMYITKQRSCYPPFPQSSVTKLRYDNSLTFFSSLPSCCTSWYCHRYIINSLLLRNWVDIVIRRKAVGVYAVTSQPNFHTTL